jgi:hypothetical protein
MLGIGTVPFNLLAAPAAISIPASVIGVTEVVTFHVIGFCRPHPAARFLLMSWSF